MGVTAREVLQAPRTPHPLAAAAVGRRPCAPRALGPGELALIGHLLGRGHVLMPPRRAQCAPVTTRAVLERMASELDEGLPLGGLGSDNGTGRRPGTAAALTPPCAAGRTPLQQRTELQTRTRRARRRLAVHRAPPAQRGQTTKARPSTTTGPSSESAQRHDSHTGTNDAGANNAATPAARR